MLTRCCRQFLLLASMMMVMAIADSMPSYTKGNTMVSTEISAFPREIAVKSNFPELVPMMQPGLMSVLLTITIRHGRGQLRQPAVGIFCKLHNSIQQRRHHAIAHVTPRHYLSLSEPGGRRLLGLKQICERKTCCCSYLAAAELSLLPLQSGV